MKRAPGPTLWNQPGVKQYLTVSLAALAVVGVLMLVRTGDFIAFIPVIVGLGAGMSGFGPMLFVIAIAVCLNTSGFAEAFTPQRLVLDVILCAAVLAFVIAQYRLQSLLAFVFPPDSRRQTDSTPASRWLGIFPRKTSITRARRPAELVTNVEITSMLWSLPIWAALACFIFLALPTAPNDIIFAPPVWQGMVLAWLFGVVWFIVSGLLEYLRFRHMSVDEAMVCLQDMVWTETRREQRRVNRWLAWRPRRRRKRRRNEILAT